MMIILAVLAYLVALYCWRRERRRLLSRLDAMDKKLYKLEFGVALIDEDLRDAQGNLMVGQCMKYFRGLTASD